MEGPLNWGGNYRYQGRRVLSPRTREEVSDLVRTTDGTLKGLATRHSFNGVADTTGTFLSTRKLDTVVDATLSPGPGFVRVEAGIPYGSLCGELHGWGRAVHNMASLPHISVGGAVATGTHGSGTASGNLATAVREIEFVRHDGTPVTVPAGHDDFPGLVVGLGAFGIVTCLTLETEDSYWMTQEVYLDLPMAELERGFRDVMAEGDSVSLFTDWQRERFTQVWIKRRVRDGRVVTCGPEFRGAKRAPRPQHPVAGGSAERCTVQSLEPGAWHERLPHFRMEHTPSVGDEFHSEYFVHLDDAYTALRAVYEMRHDLAGLLWISEIRTVDADELWMSPCYKRPSAAIHFTWRNEPTKVAPLLPTLEARLAPFEARAHWGKVFHLGKTPAEQQQLRERLRRTYPKYDDFCKLLEKYDRPGRFRNDFLRTCFG